jgi:hypothetical protein
MRAPLGSSDNPLLDQAQNHRALAAWCDKAASLIQTHGQDVVNQINGWLPDTAYAYGSQWLSPLVYDRLVAERDAHLQCAAFLEAYAGSLNAAEAQLSS